MQGAVENRLISSLPPCLLLGGGPNNDDVVKDHTALDVLRYRYRPRRTSTKKTQNAGIFILFTFCRIVYKYIRQR